MSPETASGAYIAVGSSTGASVAVGSAGAGAVVGSEAAEVGSTAGASEVVAPPQAASTKLIAMSTNTNERTNLDIYFLLLVFFTVSSYQAGFKGRRRTG
jgi:Ca2+/Na+ antiporter